MDELTMSVIATRTATGQRIPPRLPWLLRVLQRVLPAANPDIEPLLFQVELWWIEVDGGGVPQREIGFDIHGEPIVAAPFGRNHGFWTDSPVTIDVAEHDAVDAAAFATASQRFFSRWPVRPSSQPSGQMSERE
jgi:hypothetical protein